jgi:putative hydrolase of the HAD superfamily
VTTTPDLLLFDLGGVLVETPGGRLAREICVGEMPANIGAFWDSGGGHLFECGLSTPLEFAAAFDACWKLTITHDEFLVQYETWSLGLFPGAIELLDALRPRFRLAALSNSNELHWRRNRDVLGVNALFERAISSHEVGMRKPNAAFYRHALDELQVKAESVTFFDDRADNVAAAIALGMQAHRVRGIEELTACIRELGYIGLEPDSASR